MEVLNTLGHGLHEKVYENALVVEFALRGIAVRQQADFDVRYKGVAVGKSIPDLITHEALIVESKTVEKIGPNEIGQAINYLRITGLRVGLILNFKRATLEYKRVVL